VPAPRPRGGRPRRHGVMFACGDPATWPEPTGAHAEDDPQYGRVRVRAWAGRHAKPQGRPGRGSRYPRPLVRGAVVRVAVARLPREWRPPQALRIWWRGPADAVPDLALLWRAYVRRFALAHSFRFLKPVLNWTAPRVRHPEQADRWTWLVLLAYTQLRRARPTVEDRRLPWQPPQPPGRLTPGRVRRAFPLLLAVVGTRRRVRNRAAGPPAGPRAPGPVRPRASRPSRAPLEAFAGRPKCQTTGSGRPPVGPGRPNAEVRRPPSENRRSGPWQRSRPRRRSGARPR
jgi:hypothetical protein